MAILLIDELKSWIHSWNLSFVELKSVNSQCLAGEICFLLLEGGTEEERGLVLPSLLDLVDLFLFLDLLDLLFEMVMVFLPTVLSVWLLHVCSKPVFRRSKDRCPFWGDFLEPSEHPQGEFSVWGV